jgi:large subunit ribosomal protein L17
MRHRRKGRTLGRNPSHQRAMLRNLASSLFLTERDDDVDEAGYEYPSFVPPNRPKVKGRIVTTLHKAKEVRSLVEKCVTIARKGRKAEVAAAEFNTNAARGSQEWKEWRQSDQWQQWNQAMAPALTARRRLIQLLGNKEAVSVLFDDVADRFADRDGGYTRVVRIAKPRLGDSGVQAILEFVGKNDRVKQKSEKPAFDDEGDTLDEAPKDVTTEETAADETEAGDPEATTDEPTAETEATGEAAEEPADEDEKKAE